MDGMYIDEHFPPSDESLFPHGKSLPASLQVTRWVRPHELCPKPTLFGNGLGMGAKEVIPGLVDDRHLLGAMMALASDSRELIFNLLVSDEEEWLTSGQIKWKIYYNGDWQEVMVDTLIPCTSLSDSDGYPCPAFGHSKDRNVMWVPLLEKAYAKLAKTYSALHKGVVSDAMVDLTGGSAVDMTLSEIEVNEMVLDGSLLDRLQRYLKWKYVITCSFEIGDSYIDDSRTSGIISNSSYLIEDIKVLEGLEFFKLRNIWGGQMWSGDWSAESKSWTLHRDIRAALVDDTGEELSKLAANGIFWICWQDVKKSFNKFSMCRVFPESYNMYTVRGGWQGKTAAGEHRGESSTNNEEGDDDGGEGVVKAATSKVPGFRKKDLDSRWFNNPQFRISVNQGTDVYLSLMQDGLCGNPNFQLGFTLLAKKRNKESRAWRLNSKKIVCECRDNVFQSSLPQREVNKGNVFLSPDYSYILIAHTKSAGVNVGFTLRLFSKLDIHMEPFPDNITAIVSGAWEHKKSSSGDNMDTTGGPINIKSSKGEMRENYKWCSNPQYLLTLPLGYDKTSPITLAVTIKRTDKLPKNEKNQVISNPLGVTISKLPLVSFGNPRKKKALGKSSHGPTSPKPSSPTHRPKLEESLDVMKRKIFIEPASDWFHSSEYNKNDVAATLVKVPSPEWMEKGLVICPTLTSVGSEGKFQLEIHCGVDVVLEELDQTLFQTLAGEWSEGLAGGCHLGESFKKNPSFKLTVKEAGPVVITLSRPHSAWRKALKDNVGCMMGFYISKGKKINRQEPGVFVEGKPWSETPFMPTNSVSSPELYLEPLEEDDYYNIVPTTYDAKKIGPFFLTVSGRKEFAVKRIK